MTGPRVPLAEQITELAEAVNGLAERLDRLVEVGRMARAEADRKVLRLRRALDTLLWVESNAKDFIAVAQAKKRLMEDEMRAAAPEQPERSDGVASGAGRRPEQPERSDNVASGALKLPEQPERSKGVANGARGTL